MDVLLFPPNSAATGTRLNSITEWQKWRAVSECDIEMETEDKGSSAE